MITRLVAGASAAVTLVLALLCSPTEAALTYKKCHAHNGPALYQEASDIGALADEALVPSRFARVSNGYMRVIMDEEDGQEGGGATNTEVTYVDIYLICCFCDCRHFIFSPVIHNHPSAYNRLSLLLYNLLF